MPTSYYTPRIGCFQTCGNALLCCPYSALLKCGVLGASSGDWLAPLTREEGWGESSEGRIAGVAGQLKTGPAFPFLESSASSSWNRLVRHVPEKEGVRYR